MKMVPVTSLHSVPYTVKDINGTVTAKCWCEENRLPGPEHGNAMSEQGKVGRTGLNWWITWLPVSFNSRHKPTATATVIPRRQSRAYQGSGPRSTEAAGECKGRRGGPEYEPRGGRLLFGWKARYMYMGTLRVVRVLGFWLRLFSDTTHFIWSARWVWHPSRRAHAWVSISLLLYL